MEKPPVQQDGKNMGQWQGRYVFRHPAIASAVVSPQKKQAANKQYEKAEELREELNGTPR